MITEEQINEIERDYSTWEFGIREAILRGAAIGYQKAIDTKANTNTEEQVFLDAVIIALAPAFVSVSSVPTGENGHHPVLVHSLHAVLAAKLFWEAREADRIKRTEDVK